MDLPITNDKVLRYMWKKGHCEVCGRILNPNTFIQTGARVFCSHFCCNQFWIDGSSNKINNANSELRKEMREIVSNLSKRNKTVTFFKDEAPSAKEQVVIENCTVPDFTEPATDSWVQHQCDPELMSLSAEELINKYISCTDNISYYLKQNQSLKDNLKNIEEPKLIENLNDWEQFITEKKELEESVNHQVELNNKEIKKYKKDKESVTKLMYYSNEIPNGKWVRAGDKGIRIFQDGTSDIGVKVYRWEDVINELYKSESKSEKTLKPKNTGSLIKSILSWSVTILVVIGTITVVGFLATLVISVALMAPMSWAEILDSNWGYLWGFLFDIVAVGVLAFFASIFFSD